MRIRRILFIAAVCLCTTTLATAATFTPKQTKAIQAIVHDYLVKNPQVLVEASQSLQLKMRQKAQAKAIEGIKANKKMLFNDPNTPTAGNPKGNVLFVEFFDYQCGHCKAVSASVKSIMDSNKDVKFIFKELPIFGGNSAFAAKAALAAVKQGKYLALHNALLSTPDALTKQKVLNIAKKAGLNISKLSKDANDPKYQQQIRQNFELMRALGLTGTPAFIIANKAQTKFQFVPGAMSKAGLQAAINAVK